MADGRYEAFESEVGVLPHALAGGSVVFQVDVDGRRRVRQRCATARRAAAQSRVALGDAKQIVLRVGDAGTASSMTPPSGPRPGWSHPALRTFPVYLSDLYARQEHRPAARTRSLEGRWLPIVVNTAESAGRGPSPTDFRRPLHADRQSLGLCRKTRALGVAEFAVENPGQQRGRRRLPPGDDALAGSTQRRADRGADGWETRDLDRARPGPCRI